MLIPLFIVIASVRQSFQQINDGLYVFNTMDSALPYNLQLFQSQISKRPHFIMYYAPWCGHCKSMTIAFDKLAEKYNIKQHREQAVIAKIDCTQHTPLCSDNDIISYPTLIFYWSASDVYMRYKGKRDYNSLDLFVAEKIFSKPDEPSINEAPSSDVVMTTTLELTDDNFESHISTGRHFIEFYAPWCSHCKQLAPVWDQLSQTLASDHRISIAKVDCTVETETCHTLSIRGYPTLFYFANGKKIQEYQDERDHDKMLDFVLMMTARYETKQEDTQYTDRTAEIIPDDDDNKMVLEYTLDNFESNVRAGLHFIKFYTTWCHHCKMLAPTWNQLARQVNDPRVTIAQVDCDAHRQLCTDYAVPGYPTLILFNNGQVLDRYVGDRTLEALSSYLDNMVSTATQHTIRTTYTKVNNVIYITGETFTEITSTGFTFVEFYQPWCVHCKNLVPIMEALGKMTSAHDSINIAIIDCSENAPLCTEQQVNGFPSLVLYHNGVRVAEYFGKHDVLKLYNFIIQKQQQHDEL